MKNGLKFISLLAFIISFSACTSSNSAKNISGENKDYELVIVHTNDVHGRAFETEKEIGYSNIKGVINKLKEDHANKNVMFLDAGDTLHGTTFATLEKGESIAKVLDKAELKAMALGNHDFNYGANRIVELSSKHNFQMLASNVTYKDSGKPFTKKYIIEKIDGVKVGIFALSTPETLVKTNPKNVEKLNFNDPATTATAVVKELKSKGVDFIILLSHLGLDESTKKQWRSDYIAENVPGINLIIDGHSHTMLENKLVIGNSSIVQTGEYGKNVGVIRVDFDDLNKGSQAIDYELLKRERFSNNFVDNTRSVKGEITPDYDVDQTISEIKNRQSELIGKIVGVSNVKLVGDREFVRTGETNLSNLIADSMLWKSGADIAITNGGGIRSSINPGNITVENIISVLPFGNYIVVKEMTGKQIKDSLEHGFKDLPNPAGSLVQVGGITLNLNLKKTPGERVSNIIFKNGKTFDLNGKYLVATNDFMGNGGDGYKEIKAAKSVSDFGAMDEILTEYISSGIKLPKGPDSRVKILK